ncbi:hpt domain-containing protein [Apiospora arundinis]|uniref:Hpt domain-containing protein n=1 Tax=Apiospora arundinis TaxID=335852 RepID=A0ABR2IXB1_9PEZI
MSSNHHGGGDANLPDLGGSIDSEIFSQILEMDASENDREFSQSIVFGFFEQAEETFERMDEALEAKNMDELSELGHFLKGSSGTLGLTKVSDSCEKIQRYGKQKNEDGTPETDEELCLSRVTDALKSLKAEYSEAETVLRDFFNTPGP